MMMMMMIAEDTGRFLELQWIRYYAIISGNQIADSLATRAHSYENKRIIFIRFVTARFLLLEIMRLPHSYLFVSLGTTLPHVLRRGSSYVSILRPFNCCAGTRRSDFLDFDNFLGLQAVPAKPVACNNIFKSFLSTDGTTAVKVTPRLQSFSEQVVVIRPWNIIISRGIKLLDVKRNFTTL